MKDVRIVFPNVILRRQESIIEVAKSVASLAIEDCLL